MIAAIKDHPAGPALVAYGIDDPYTIDKAIAYKMSNYGHYYIALLYEDGQVIDLAAPTYDGPWEVQNDGSEPVTPKQFKKMFIPDGCDWLEGWPE